MPAQAATLQPISPSYLPKVRFMLMTLDAFSSVTMIVDQSSDCAPI